MMGERSRTDVLVVGAGQAGIAAARALAAAGIEFRVQERSPRIGDAWRQRFDSLVLFSPRAMDELSGARLPGDPDGYPSKDEVGDYLERYVQALALPVTTGDGVARLSREASGLFLAVTDAGREVKARAVVIAAGAFQRPLVPRFASGLADGVRQLDAATYRNPGSVRGRRVTVIGDGATGRQIALELFDAGYEVTLATGRRRNFGPQRLLGRDANRQAFALGLLTADKRTWRGRLMRALNVTPGLHMRLGALRRAGIRLAPRCVDAAGSRLAFADGSARDCDTVIFTLGYRDETGWVDIDGAATASRFIEDRGISPVAGLFHIGREWQTCRASALLCGVARDADVIADRVGRYLAGDGGGDG